MIRKGFTLTELLIGISIMSILAGVMTLNTSSIGKQTAKREAERTAAYIKEVMRKADIAHEVVWITVKASTNEIEIITGDDFNEARIDQPIFKTSNKCEYTTGLKLVYPRYEDKELGILGGKYTHAVQGSYVTVGTGTSEPFFTVKGEDGKTCNVIIIGR